MHDENKDDVVASAAAATLNPDNDVAGGGEFPGVDESSAPPLKPFSRTSAPSSRGAFHPDVPGRAVSIPGVPSKPIGPSDNDDQIAIEPQHLLMGREIHLKGGVITSCKRLTLDGQVEEATLTGAQTLEVSPVGTFKGKAEVDEAVIAGRFEGELTARKRLIVRETGSITGKVTYGSIIIEPGGQISGEMQSFNDAT